MKNVHVHVGRTSVQVLIKDKAMENSPKTAAIYDNARTPNSEITD